MFRFVVQWQVWRKRREGKGSARRKIQIIGGGAEILWLAEVKSKVSQVRLRPSPATVPGLGDAKSQTPVCLEQRAAQVTVKCETTC